MRSHWYNFLQFRVTRFVHVGDRNAFCLPPQFPHQLPTKQSHGALVRLLESGIREIGDLRSDRFFIIVRVVVVSGSPPTKLLASVLVRFLPAGAPFCCGEPSCYSAVFRDDGAKELGDYMRRKMNLQHTVSVALNVAAEDYDDISFSALGSGQ